MPEKHRGPYYRVFYIERPNGRCHWVARGRPHGKPERHYFSSKPEADAWARDQNDLIRRRGAEALSIPREVRLEAYQAMEKLKGAGLSLTQAAEIALERVQAREQSKTVAEVVKLCLQLNARLADKGEVSKDHLANLLKCGRRLTPAFGDQLCSDVTRAAIVKWLDEMPLAAASKDFFRRYALAFFAFAVARGYSKTNPAQGIPRFASSREIEVLTVDQARNLLDAAQAAMIPYYAIGLFAGLRPLSELKRLSWNAFDWADRIITVPNFKTFKTGSARNRHVAISNNLMAWLEPFRLAQGPIWPTNWRRLHYAALKKAGISSWPHDALRRSYASYLLALCQDAARVADQMGHEDSSMLFRKYRRLVRPTDAAAYWEIYPPWHSKDALSEK